MEGTVGLEPTLLCFAGTVLSHSVRTLAGKIGVQPIEPRFGISAPHRRLPLEEGQGFEPWGHLHDTRSVSNREP